MLIATDLDGTFLRPDATVSARNLAALEAAEAAGIHVVPVTGRAIGGLRILGPIFRRYALVSNGAVGVDLSAGATLFTKTMSASTVRAYVDRLTVEIPGTVFCAEIGDSSVFLVEDGYDDIVPPFESKNDPAEHVLVSRDELCSTEAVKLMIVHPSVPAGEVYERSRLLDTPGVHSTWAGFTVTEAGPAGVTKASGLEHICKVLGQDRADVVALGDGANDVEMLQWAGTSYAMGGAKPEAVAVADLRAPSCVDDGFAVVVEKILASR